VEDATWTCVFKHLGVIKPGVLSQTLRGGYVDDLSVGKQTVGDEIEICCKKKSENKKK
jgi:translation initiation factor 2 gamma subunit (eIF-2gamma)